MATDFEKEITCPYCGEVFADSWEYNENECGETECDECGKKFTYSVNFEVSYSTRKIDCDEHNFDKPYEVKYTQEKCDKWNKEGFMNKTHTPHSLWIRDCNNCDTREYKQTELNAKCPW